MGKFEKIALGIANGFGIKGGNVHSQVYVWTGRRCEGRHVQYARFFLHCSIV